MGSTFSKSHYYTTLFHKRHVRVVVNKNEILHARQGDGCYAGGEQLGQGEELQRQWVHQEERPEGTDHQQDGKADEAVDEAVEGPLEAAEEQCQ